MKRVSLFNCTVVLAVIAMILFCGELPQNPIIDPNNAEVHFFTDKRNPSVNQGSSLEIGFEIVLEQHISSILVESSCGSVDTLILPNGDNVRDTIMFHPVFDVAKPCTLTAKATLIKSEIRKFDTLIVYVLPKDTNTQGGTIPTNKPDTGKSITPSIIDAPSNLIAGTADTLVFAVDNSERDDTLSVQLVTSEGKSLDPARFTVLPSGTDSIVIAVAPTATASTDTFTIGIATTNGTVTDTSWYPVTFLQKDQALWNTSDLALNATEGAALQHDLLPLLSSAEGVTLTATIGTITGTTWEWTPPYGSETSATATVTAKKGEKVMTLTLKLTVAPGDQTPPALALVDKTLDGKTVGSSQLTVACTATDEGAGIATVTFACGTETVDATLQSDATWSGVISGLTNGVPAEVTITATDKSMKKNRAELTFTVTYDSNVLDDEAPAIAHAGGPKSGERVMEAQGSISCTITDGSEVDSAWWTLNDAPGGALVAGADGKYTLTYALSTFGDNTIKVFARDGSPNKNSGSTEITLVYNSSPGAIAAATPADKATDISVTPSFTWTGGEDTDGDTVYYQVSYGATAASLTTVLPETKEPSAAIAATSALTANTAYFWKVMAYTKAPYKDTVQSNVVSFTTSGSVPVITANLEPALTVNEGEALELNVVATATPEPTYQWYKDNAPITGQITAAFSKTGVTATDAGVYHVVVSNGVGAGVPSAKTTVTVAAKVVISKNPVAASADEGGSATFTVEATGGGLLDYQWLKDEVAVSGATKATYTITAVSTGDAGKYSCEVSNTFSKATSTAATLTVTPKHTVTFDVDGGSPAVSPVTVKDGEKVAEPTTKPTKTGYEFAGWYAKGNTTTPFAFTTTPVTADMTIVAKWDQLFTLTYNDNYATAHNAPAEKQYKRGEVATVTAPPTTMTKTGCTCVGWCLNFNCSSGSYKGGETITMNSDVTLSAHWVVTVTFNADGGTPAPGQITIDEKTSLGTQFPANPSKANNTFDGWYNGNTQILANTLINSDMTVTAKWQEQKCTITFMCNGEEFDKKTVTKGSTVSIPTSGCTGTGCTQFAGWSTTPNGGVNYSASGISQITVSSDIFLYGVMSTTVYKITFLGNGGNNRVPFESTGKSDIDIKEGKCGMAFTMPSNGFENITYNFKGWSRNPEINSGNPVFQPGESFYPEEDVIFYALWLHYTEDQ